MAFYRKTRVKLFSRLAVTTSKNCVFASVFGEPGRTRTSNPLLNCQSLEINGFSDFRAVQVGRFERFWSRLLPSCYQGDEHRCIS